MLESTVAVGHTYAGITAASGLEHRNQGEEDLELGVQQRYVLATKYLGEQE